MRGHSNEVENSFPMFVRMNNIRRNVTRVGGFLLSFEWATVGAGGVLGRAILLPTLTFRFAFPAWNGPMRFQGLCHFVSVGKCLHNCLADNGNLFLA